MKTEGMVHALKEAWRVLIPQGIMVDVRPLSVDTPLEIVSEGKSQIAGIVDMTPGSVYDQDVDRAIESVTRDRLFTGTKLEFFKYTYNWKTIEGMQEDMEENWQGEVIVTNDVWEKARVIKERLGPMSQLRVASRMKLGIYEKIG